MTPEVERQQQKAKEFMSLLPLTLALAGLPTSEPGKQHYTESQIEARVAINDHVIDPTAHIAERNLGFKLQRTRLSCLSHWLICKGKQGQSP